MTNLESHPTLIPDPESARLLEPRRHCDLSKQFGGERRGTTFQCAGPNHSSPRMALVTQSFLHPNLPLPIVFDPFRAAVAKFSSFTIPM